MDHASIESAMEQKYDSIIGLFNGEDFVEGPLAFSENEAGIILQKCGYLTKSRTLHKPSRTNNLSKEISVKLTAQAKKICENN